MSLWSRLTILQLILQCAKITCCTGIRWFETSRRSCNVTVMNPLHISRDTLFVCVVVCPHYLLSFYWLSENNWVHSHSSHSIHHVTILHVKSFNITSERRNCSNHQDNIEKVWILFNVKKVSKEKMHFHFATRASEALQWRHMNVKVLRITDNSTVCLTAYSG